MGRGEQYLNELGKLVQEAESLIQQSTRSEHLLSDLWIRTCEEIKAVYLEEALKRIDRIVERRIARIDERESKTGPTITKELLGFVGARLSQSQNETARQFAGPALDGYYMDETERAEIREAAESAKRKIESETVHARTQEFLKSTGGLRTMLESLDKILQDELKRIPREKSNIM